MIHQMTMAGDDWLSDRDRKAIARAHAARAKAARKAARALIDAADALGEFAMACIECADASAPRGEDDSRYRLSTDMRDYAAWLEGVYR